MPKRDQNLKPINKVDSKMVTAVTGTTDCLKYIFGFNPGKPTALIPRVRALPARQLGSGYGYRAARNYEMS